MSQWLPLVLNWFDSVAGRGRGRGGVPGRGGVIVVAPQANTLLPVGQAVNLAALNNNAQYRQPVKNKRELARQAQQDSDC